MNAKMPTREFTEFYYNACLVDYAQLKEAMDPLKLDLEPQQIHLKVRVLTLYFQ